MTDSPQLPLDTTPRTVDIPYNDFLPFLDAHPDANVFLLIVKPGHYRVTWRPGERTVNNPPPNSLDTAAGK